MPANGDKKNNHETAIQDLFCGFYRKFTPCSGKCRRFQPCHHEYAELKEWAGIA